MSDDKTKLETRGVPPIGTSSGNNDIPLDLDGNLDFEKCTIEQALAQLNATEGGLTDDEAKRRIQEYGPNALPSKKKSKILKFLMFMWNPLSWAMEVAAIIAIGLLDYADFALICSLLILNACIGYLEESSADNAIQALMASLAPQTRVLRNGNVQALDAIDLVPGDVVMIRLGDIVPADCKLLGDKDHEPMLIDQAALTGESMPVKRFPGQVAYSGSGVKQGESFAMVYGTGVNTFFGKAAQLIDGTDNPGHLQAVMTAIGGTCLVTIAVWMLIELAVELGFYMHPCGSGGGGCPILSNMLVVIVGGIPIAMPTVLSVTLALGAVNLTSHGAIVSRLTAIEELAGMNMLCSDKTGTLTLNVLSVDMSNLDSTAPFEPMDILKYGALSARIENDEPIDVCVDASYTGRDTLWKEYSCTKYVPFNPTDKRTVATVKCHATGEVLRACKGAPQIVLGLAWNLPEIKTVVEARILEYASRGYRALGVAMARGDGVDGETKWEFVGLIPIYDPPRHDTKETVERCGVLGIGVKMITGDQLPIGVETARQLGMGTNMHTTKAFLELAAGKFEGGQEALDKMILESDGFAEVFPEHKYEIVHRLQYQGFMTGMTGDGVNDAPALKKADIGIAVAGATDAARAAADIVLTEPGLSVIVDSVIQSRKIFQRMKNYAMYTVATTYRICFTFGLLTVIYDWFFPTILIVLLAIFNDGAMIALSKDRAIPSKSPDAWFLKRIFTTGLIYGLYMTLSTWILFYVAGTTNWFPHHLKLFSLQYNQAWETCANTTLTNFVAFEYDGENCITHIVTEPTPLYSPFLTTPGSISAVYPDQWHHCNITAPSAYEQCVAEVHWERQSMLRGLIFSQVAISGQALIFVTRSVGVSITERPGFYLMLAFAGAQLVSSIIAGLGFDAYPYPQIHVPHNKFCERWHGMAPVANTESEFNASLLGCHLYVIVAWIWSMIFYCALDPLKFFINYVFDTGLLDTTGGGVTELAPKAPSETPAHTKAKSTGLPRASAVVRGSVM